MSRLDPGEWEVKCTFPHSDPRPSALAQPVAAGCKGYRTDIWLHGHDLRLEPAGLVSKGENDLKLRLDSLLIKIQPRQISDSSQILLDPQELVPAGESDPLDSFFLVLEVKTPGQEFYLSVISELGSLRQRGYLTTWYGVDLVPGRVTVIVTGETAPDFHCSEESHTVIFWIPLDNILRDEVTNDLLVPVCAI